MATPSWEAGGSRKSALAARGPLPTPMSTMARSARCSHAMGTLGGTGHSANTATPPCLLRLAAKCAPQRNHLAVQYFASLSRRLPCPRRARRRGRKSAAGALASMALHSRIAPLNVRVAGTTLYWRFIGKVAPWSDPDGVDQRYSAGVLYCVRSWQGLEWLQSLLQTRCYLFCAGRTARGY